MIRISAWLMTRRRIPRHGRYLFIHHQMEREADIASFAVLLQFFLSFSWFSWFFVAFLLQNQSEQTLHRKLENCRFGQRFRSPKNERLLLAAFVNVVNCGQTLVESFTPFFLYWKFWSIYSYLHDVLACMDSKVMTGNFFIVLDPLSQIYWFKFLSGEWRMIVR